MAGAGDRRTTLVGSRLVSPYQICPAIRNFGQGDARMFVGGCKASLKAKVSLLYRSIYIREIYISYEKESQLLTQSIVLPNKRYKTRESVCNMRITQYSEK